MKKQSNVVNIKSHFDDAAKQLTLPKSTLTSWARSFKAGMLGEIGKNYRGLSETELELAKLRRERYGTQPPTVHLSVCIYYRSRCIEKIAATANID